MSSNELTHAGLANTALPIRVLIVDDHTVVRKGLIFVLQDFADIQVVGEADSVESALLQCHNVQPEVVLMDIKMAGPVDGLDAIRQIRQRYPKIQVIMLTSFNDPHFVQRAVQQGAIGYLLKDVSTDELAQAIRQAYLGKLTLSPEATQALQQSFQPFEHTAEIELTGRQREVLRLLIQGLTNTEIALRLQITSHTARHHVSELLARLNAANRAEAAAIAIKLGLLKD